MRVIPAMGISFSPTDPSTITARPGWTVPQLLNGWTHLATDPFQYRPTKDGGIEFVGHLMPPPGNFAAVPVMLFSKDFEEHFGRKTVQEHFGRVTTASIDDRGFLFVEER